MISGTSDAVVVQINIKIVFAEMGALGRLRNFGDQLGGASFKLLTHFRRAKRAISNRGLHVIAGVRFAGIDQRRRRFAILRITRDDVDGRNQLRIRIRGHRDFVTVEASTRTLASVPHLRITGGNDTVFRQKKIDAKMTQGFLATRFFPARIA
jgi:hypothetical protein